MEDDSFILSLLNEEDWLRFIGDRNVNSINDARLFIANKLSVNHRDGMGLRVACELKTDTPMGFKLGGRIDIIGSDSAPLLHYLWDKRRS